MADAHLDDKLHWYKDAVIYELHIKAFYDSNEDGMGDFGGLLQKLDYLQELGVTAIWLLPFYPSPLRDDGYDIADYYHINSSYGKIDDFKKLLEEAHRRHLKVITELVINHTSDQHEWFQRARTAPKGSEERNFYVWTDDPSQYKDVRIIFQDFESSNWTWDEVAQQYYWHRFFYHQPDLNYDNPKVQEEVFKIMDYWCAMGVDGFRLDAVPYLFEREGTNGENLPETHAFLKKLRKHIDENFPGTMLLAEANMWPEDSASYFGNADECHMNYHFPLMPRMFMALQMEDRYPITDIFDQTPAIPKTCQWAMFLRNHDELTLEMVTDEERDYMYQVYAKDAKARINLGIRHRLAPLMENDRRKIELMNSLLFSMPGTPVIYYGDEIGMGDNFHLGDRDGVRTPMQWSPDRNAGFSRTNPQQLYLPVIMDPQYHYESVNVETQMLNTSSLLWFMKHLISVRKKYKAFGRGEMKFINVDNAKVLAFTRSYEDETILVVVNLSKFAQPAEVDLGDFSGYTPVEIFSKNNFPPVKENLPYFFTLSPHSFQWFVLEKAAQEPVKKEELPLVTLSKWDEILDEGVIEELESDVLPPYLQNAPWFSGSHRPFFDCRIIETLNLRFDGGHALLTLVEVNYKAGLPENYFVPLSFVADDVAEEVVQEYRQAVLAKTTMKGKRGILCDAFYLPSFQSWLFRSFANCENISSRKFEINFASSGRLRNYLERNSEIRSRVYLGKLQHHTDITYDNQFFLKVYRKVDLGINPDREMCQYLSQRHFQYTPECLGAMEWKFRKGSYSIATLEKMIENHGDGYSYMTERIHNYIERIVAQKQSSENIDWDGELLDPPAFEELPGELQDLLGARASEQSRLFGQRVGELHLLLRDEKRSKDFIPESFSLHYQRSLFSSAVGLVRETYNNLQRRRDAAPVNQKESIDELLGRKSDMLGLFRRIYHKKLDTVKTRIHGSLGLGHIMLTGKDVAIHDFEGYPMKRYSETRLKRSPLVDVASMIRSYYYVAYEGFLSSPEFKNGEVKNLLHWADLWIHYMSGFFLRSWLQVVKESDILPRSKEDLQLVLQNFLLEKALLALNYDINNRPGAVIIPLTMVRDILD